MDLVDRYHEHDHEQSHIAALREEGAGDAGGDGAGDRNRTYDLRVTSALLYRLSYTGWVWYIR